MKRAHKILGLAVIVILIFGWFYNYPPVRFGGQGWPQIWNSPPKIQEARAAAGDVILMWDNTSGGIPAGWTCISCAATDPFFGVFPRASSTYGAASSSMDNATHTVALLTEAAGAANAAGGLAGATLPLSTHTHGFSSFNSSSSDIRPPFNNLQFIRANNPSTLPNGTIGIFDVAATSSLPANWSYYSAIGARYLRGENVTSTGGAATHTHTFSGTSGASTNGIGAGGGSSVTIPVASHTHNATGTTAAASSSPPFINVVFAQLSATSSVPNGLIAMFDNTSLPANWNIVSTSGSAYAGNLLRGFNSFGTTGGASFHNHASSTVASTVESATASQISEDGSASFFPALNHTHQFTFSFASSTGNSMPVYRDVILGKFTAAGGTVSCSTNITTSTFSTLTTGAVSTASPNASTTFSCTFSLGCTLSISDTGLATSSPAYTIASTTGALVAGTEGWGIQATSTSAGSGATLTINSIYNVSGNTVGNLGASTVLASTTTTFSNREVVVTHKAAISAATQAGSYADTITYTCVGN